MRLTAENVEAILRDCLDSDDLPERTESDYAGDADYIIVGGILHKYALRRAKLDQHAEEIIEMLAELPLEFRRNVGGGWSFLNACMTNDGEQWTGFHRTMEQLFVLGIGIGRAQWVPSQADLWGAFPGGVPYVQVIDD